MNNKTVLNSAFEWCEELHVNRSHLWDSGILAANRRVLNSPDAKQSSNSQRLFKISINKHGYFTWICALCSQNRAKHTIQIVRPVAGNNGHWECDFFTIWQGVCFDIQWCWVWTWNTIQMANIAGLHMMSRRPYIWWSRTKHFSPLGTSLLSCNFFKKKFLCIDFQGGYLVTLLQTKNFFHWLSTRCSLWASSSFGGVSTSQTRTAHERRRQCEGQGEGRGPCMSSGFLR